MYPRGKSAYLKVKKALEAEYGKNSTRVYATLVARGFYVAERKHTSAIDVAYRKSHKLTTRLRGNRARG